MLPDNYTFRLIDGYTGEILKDVGDKFNSDDIPSNARILVVGDNNLMFVHTASLSACNCKDCMTDLEFEESTFKSNK